MNDWGPMFTPAPSGVGTPAPEGNPHRLRWYQLEAVQAVAERFREFRSTLLVMATGTGKTRTFGAIAADHPGRVLILAHRDELIGQAANAMRELTGGEWIGIEKAEQRAGRERIVVASVQSACRERRLGRLAGGRGFDLVVIDECHHATASSYRTVLEAFPEAKVLGVTATPDRADQQALGDVFESSAYNFDILAGIEAGYLVPIDGMRLELPEIDLSAVRTVAGDLNAGDLDKAMAGALEGIVQSTINHFPDRCGPVFLPSKRAAVYAAERFNAAHPGCAAVVTDDTDPEERKSIMRAVKRGDVQWLCNVDVATEGFDWPAASVMIGGRPTKSRSKYAQQVGRVTRPLGDAVNNIPGRDGAEARRAAILASAKPRAVIADFVGNSGRHSLCSVEDVLGGRYGAEEVERAKAKAKANKGGDAAEYLRQSRRELEALAAAASAVRLKVEARRSAFDPFRTMGLGYTQEEAESRMRRVGGTPASQKQIDALLKFGMKPEEVRNMTKADASKAISKLIERKSQNLAALWQVRALGEHGIPADVASALEYGRAKAAYDYLKSVNFGRGREVDRARLEAMCR